VELGGPQSAPWSEEATVRIGAIKDKNDPKYKLKEAPAKEVEVSAKDQVYF